MRALIIAFIVTVVAYTFGLSWAYQHQKHDAIIKHTYQLRCLPDSLQVWDGDRKVGTIPYDSSATSELILKDNQ